MGDVTKPADTMTQMAEFECRRKAHTDREGFEYGESFVKTEQRPVTIKIIPDESPAEMEDRFEKAADIELFGINARQEMRECQGRPISFTRFVSTAPEFLKAKAEWDKATQKSAAEVDTALSRIYQQEEKTGGHPSCYR